MDSLQKDQDEIIAMLSGFMQKRYSHDLMKRFFHPKTHGLLKATLTISPDIPKEWQIGIFQAGKQYKCWVRFSSTNPHVKPDWKKNFRGLALKVLDEDFTQDFLSANLPIFQAKDIPMLKSVLRAMTGNIWNKLMFFFKYPWRAIKALRTNYPCYNLLEVRYWAQAAFKLGDNFAVRYSFVPQQPATSTKPQNPSDNFLRERLRTDFDKNDAFFDFMVQFRTNPATMSVEDNTKEWDSPWHKIATIHIPQQSFDFESRNQLGENMEFNPWYCLPEHEPIGNLHLIRKSIYKHLQQYRHAHNQIIYEKPTLKDWESTP